MTIRIDGTNTTANPGITGADADTGLQFGTNELKLVTGGTEAVKIDSNQKLTASQGILFGTDTAAANTLDDYEEGTWTPVFEGGTTAGTYTYQTAQEGSYVKIGNLVHLCCNLNAINTVTAGSGQLFVSGIPFPQSTSSNVFGQGTTRFRFFDVPSNTVDVSVTVASTSDRLTVVACADNGNTTALSVTNKTQNTAQLFISVSYFTD
tara:strand:+ start:1025 stop:1645 length:621 start_codon:yes stop_codon:yes gene_type:complete